MTNDESIPMEHREYCVHTSLGELHFTSSAYFDMYEHCVKFHSELEPLVASVVHMLEESAVVYIDDEDHKFLQEIVDYFKKYPERVVDEQRTYFGNNDVQLTEEEMQRAALQSWQPTGAPQ